MPQLTVEGYGTFQVPQGKRLVNALTDDAKVDQMHACGGHAQCTTCRVRFIGGAPEKMTQAERQILAAKGLDRFPGVRLSCQIACDHDMNVEAISRMSQSKKADPGPRPADAIEPPAVWT
jgi:ferredoxin